MLTRRTAQSNLKGREIMQDLRYPIGTFQRQPVPDSEERSRLIASMRGLPQLLRKMVGDLTDSQLDTPYREGGWKIRQVIHHLADSHLNGYVRFKLAITEDVPEIKSYNQDAWAQTADNFHTPVLVSVGLLENIHQRWTALLKMLDDRDFDRKFRHPESGIWTLHETLALYEWHGRHHLAQIQAARKNKRW